MSRYDTLKTRILDQFKNSYNILSEYKAFFNRMDDTDQLLSDLSLKRWIETAEGVWLDNCGDIVGIYPRPPALVDDNLMFTCKAIGEPDNINKAFADVDQTFGGFLSAIGGLPSETPVNDDVYRQYIRAKAFTTNQYTAMRNTVIFCRNIFNIDVDVTTPEYGLMVATPTAPVDTQTRRIIEQLAPVSAAMDFRVELV